MMWRKVKPCALLMGSKIGTVTMRMSMMFKTLKNNYCYMILHNTFGYISKENG